MRYPRRVRIEENRLRCGCVPNYAYHHVRRSRLGAGDTPRRFTNVHRSADGQRPARQTHFPEQQHLGSRGISRSRQHADPEHVARIARARRRYIGVRQLPPGVRRLEIAQLPERQCRPRRTIETDARVFTAGRQCFIQNKAGILT